MTGRWFDLGIAGRPLPGESTSGDTAFHAEQDGAVLLAVVDGLGHGDEAAAASLAAVEVIAAHAMDPIDRLFQRVHQALGRTRGAVMTIARLEPGTLSWCAVGNVEGYLARSDGRRDRVLAAGGIVGHSLPRLRVASLPFGGSDILVLATDGIRHDYASIRAYHTAQAAADAVLAEGAQPGDDALVLVVRQTAGAS